jgi:hypothetical protein
MKMEMCTKHHRRSKWVKPTSVINCRECLIDRLTKENEGRTETNFRQAAKINAITGRGYAFHNKLTELLDGDIHDDDFSVCDAIEQLKAEYDAYRRTAIAEIEFSEAERDRLREALELLCCDARYLSDHEIDGGAPDNRWDDMRDALTVAESLLNRTP